MIMYTDKNGVKIDLKLKSGWLPYNQSVVYLGSLFSDSGNIQEDIVHNAVNKDKVISIKLANFIVNNQYAPKTVKYKVLNSCVKAAILQACETWEGSN